MTIHLCFDTYQKAHAAHRAVADSESASRMWCSRPGRRVDMLRVDMEDGTSIRFHVKTKHHPPIGVHCACEVPHE